MRKANIVEFLYDISLEYLKDFYKISSNFSSPRKKIFIHLQFLLIEYGIHPFVTRHSKLHKFVKVALFINFQTVLNLLSQDYYLSIPN